jgi:tRNA threonylcarbamoyladenosine biosynthesis protein TsaE
MTPQALFHAQNPDQTCALAQRLGAVLASGDVLLLSGEIGAGKTHFARCLIQSRLRVPEDVPSPTFTLVQTYDTDRGEIWHADLYRLGDPDHCVELGLTEAFETAISLIEWPDRLADLTPDDALALDFTPGGTEDSRTITLSWTAPRWSDIVSQALA